MRLNDTTIKRLKAPDDVGKHADGRGLYLLVTATGAKVWRYDYRVNGRRKTISFGSYADVSPAKARTKHQAARTLVADGIDPSTARKETKRAQRAAATFGEVAKEWTSKQKLAPATVKRNAIVLDRYLLPKLNGRLVSSLTPLDLLEVLRDAETKRRYSSAKRARQLASQILRYAVATGRVSRDISTDLRGALVRAPVTRRAAIIVPDEVGALLRAIDGYFGRYDGAGALLRLAPLVFVRPGELRKAEWSEINLAAALWRIPAKKMKMGDDHLVPLSTQALAILKEQQARATDSVYVFPSLRTVDRPMSDNTLNAALRRLGYAGDQMTGHGFRAMARTLLDEQLRFPPDVIEVQLAHIVRGPLGATYNRSRYLEERTKMMQAYADYLDALKAKV